MLKIEIVIICANDMPVPGSESMVLTSFSMYIIVLCQFQRNVAWDIKWPSYVRPSGICRSRVSAATTPIFVSSSLIEAFPCVVMHCHIYTCVGQVMCCPWAAQGVVFHGV